MNESGVTPQVSRRANDSIEYPTMISQYLSRDGDS